LDTAGAEVVTMGENYGLRLLKDGHIHFYLTTNPNMLSPYDLDVNDSASLADGQWHHVAGTYNGSIMRLFFDGDERASMGPRAKLVYPHGKDFRIGSHGEGKPGWGFNGDLDEIEMSPRVRAPEWLQLRYENQRAGSKLIQIK
jgi:hypothetical protein